MQGLIYPENGPFWRGLPPGDTPPWLGNPCHVGLLRGLVPAHRSGTLGLLLVAPEDILSAPSGGEYLQVQSLV